jgi:ubiquinone/menaquinone biosynthesis C-methylase UbiE
MESMDDQNFEDSKTALEWIQRIESDNAKLRERDLYPRLRDWIRHVSPQEILDVGAGQGICSDHLELGHRKYTGLEPSLCLLDRAKELYPQENRKFVLGNIYQMPFSDGLFDAVFSVSVWHLLSDLKQGSAEVSRVLKGSGHFLIITANPEAYSLWTSQYTQFVLAGRRLDGKVVEDGKVISQDTLYLHTLEEISKALELAGLKTTKVETFRSNEKKQCQYICIQGQKTKV